MLSKYEVSEKLESLKECEKISIIVNEGSAFEVYYKDIVNDTEQECIFINSPFEKDKKMFLYCSIHSILPV